MFSALSNLFKRETLKGFSDLEKTADVHCHILSGVDDGFQSLQDSIDALKRYQELGYKKVYLTPHMNLDSFAGNNETMLKERYARFMDAIPSDLNLDIRLAAEYMVNEDLDLDREFLTFADRTVLIEMSYYFESPNIKDVIYNLSLDGYNLVLAHPERYMFYHRKISKIEELVNLGCRLQLNILSLTPYYSQGTIAMAQELLKSGMYSFIGNDLHTLKQLDGIEKVSFKADLLPYLQKLYNNNLTLFD